MAENRGKQFEGVIREALEKVPEVSVVRLHDQTAGYLGGNNHCDFIIYKKPYEYHIECKSVHGNTLSIHSIPKPDRFGVLHGFYGDITDTQWKGLIEKSKVPGIIAGVICWWVDKDVTLFLPINDLEVLYNIGEKSVRYDIVNSIDNEDGTIIEINGKKKRVFFDYDMEELLNMLANNERGWDC